ncbi:MAG: WD40 repeat domain-containing protein, partial [Candidatus Hodarchaeales archaeon]
MFFLAIFLSALLARPQAVFSDQEGHFDSVTTVDWHPDGTKIASGSDDGTVKIWDTLDYSVTLTLDMKSEVLT